MDGGKTGAKKWVASLFNFCIELCLEPGASHPSTKSCRKLGLRVSSTASHPLSVYGAYSSTRSGNIAQVIQTYNTPCGGLILPFGRATSIDHRILCLIIVHVLSFASQHACPSPVSALFVAPIAV